MKLKRVQSFQMPEAGKLADFLRNTPMNETSVMECENLSEFQTATTTAYRVRKEQQSKFGKNFIVTRSTATQSVSISQKP